MLFVHNVMLIIVFTPSHGGDPFQIKYNFIYPCEEDEHPDVYVASPI